MKNYRLTDRRFRATFSPVEQALGALLLLTKPVSTRCLAGGALFLPGCRASALPVQVGGVVVAVQPGVLHQQVLRQHVVGHQSERQAAPLGLQKRTESTVVSALPAHPPQISHWF